jgi:hypothetical protein
MTEAIAPRDAVMQLIDLAKIIAEDAPVIAKSRKQLYDAYINEGFTEEQAFQMVKPQPGNLF